MSGLGPSFSAILVDLTTPVLAIVIFASVLGATALGIFVGRRISHLSEHLSESLGVLQGAMLGVVGLILAFGLSLAVSRYETRRVAVVDEANAIGTAFLRAQTLPEPERGISLTLLTDYARSAVRVSENIPEGEEQREAVESEGFLQRRLWSRAGDALVEEPVATGPRLYLESLNVVFDTENSRVAALNNRVPSAVIIFEILGAMLALGLLATYLAMIGRGILAISMASVLVAMLLFITCDLDRPTRGPIEVPDEALREQLDQMLLPPAARGPDDPTRQPPS